jgi:hypothetical protein
LELFKTGGDIPGTNYIFMVFLFIKFFGVNSELNNFFSRGTLLIEVTIVLKLSNCCFV